MRVTSGTFANSLILVLVRTTISLARGVTAEAWPSISMIPYSTHVCSPVRPSVWNWRVDAGVVCFLGDPAQLGWTMHFVSSLDAYSLFLTVCAWRFRPYAHSIPYQNAFDISPGSLLSSVTRRFSREVGIRLAKTCVTDFQAWRSSSTVFMCTFSPAISLSSKATQCIQGISRSLGLMSGVLLLETMTPSQHVGLPVNWTAVFHAFCATATTALSEAPPSTRSTRQSVMARRPVGKVRGSLLLRVAWRSVGMVPLRCAGSCSQFIDSGPVLFWDFNYKCVSQRVYTLLRQQSASMGSARLLCHIVAFPVPFADTLSWTFPATTNVSSLLVSVLSCFQNVTFPAGRAVLRTAIVFRFLDVERRQINAFPLMKGCPRFIDHWLSRCDDPQFESLWFVTMYLHVEQGYLVIEWWSRRLEQEFLHFGWYCFFPSSFGRYCRLPFWGVMI